MSTISSSTTSTTAFGVTADTTGALVIQTGATPTTAMTIDTSQNVGVGVTPSAWRTAYGTKVIQFGPVSHVAGLSASSTNNRTSVGCNFYINSSGNQIYMNSDYTTEYQQTNGYHSFLTAPSGTAGGTATTVETLRISPTGAVILQGGSTSATGVGIAFPATQSASSDANTLDDYEEGTWSPTIEGTSTAGTVTYVARNAKYTKVGRLVVLNTYVSWNSGTGTGNLRMSGLPFVEAGGAVYPAVTLSEFDSITMTALYFPSAYVGNGLSTIQFEQAPTGGGNTIAVPYDGAGQAIISVTYFTS